MGFYRKVDDHYEITIDHTRMMLAVIGGVLLVSLVFLVGVLVGKSMWAAPQSASLALEGERASAPDASESKAAKPAAKPKEQPLYTFYDEVNKPDGQVKSPPERRPEAAGAQQGSTTIVTGTNGSRKVGSGESSVAALPEGAAAGEATAPTQDSEIQEQPPAPKAEQAQAARSEPAPEPAPEPVVAKAAPTATPGGAYSVQVHSFVDYDTAKKSVDGYKKKGVAAYVAEGEVKGKTWYRVRLGPFSTRADADDYLAKMNEDVKFKKLKAYVVKN